MQEVEFYQLPLWVRLAAPLTVFNTWVVIDRYGLDDYLPFYRYGEVCLWDIGIMVSLGIAFVRALRNPHADSKKPSTVAAG